MEGEKALFAFVCVVAAINFGLMIGQIVLFIILQKQKYHYSNGQAFNIPKGYFAIGVGEKWIIREESLNANIQDECMYNDMANLMELKRDDDSED